MIQHPTDELILTYFIFLFMDGLQLAQLSLFKHLVFEMQPFSYASISITHALLIVNPPSCGATFLQVSTPPHFHRKQSDFFGTKTCSFIMHPPAGEAAVL